MNGVHAAFTGRICSDPEPRFTQGGKALLTFSVAVDQSYVADAQRAAPEALYCRVTVWEGLAEDLTPVLAKGALVYVEGRLRLDRWTTREGEARAGLSVSAWRCDLHGRIGQAAPPPGERSA